MKTQLLDTSHRGRSERGFTLVATAILLAFALLAITGVAVELPRLMLTATEVQLSADASALSAALAIAQQQSPSVAQARGRLAAARNAADGRLVDAGGVEIDIGNFSSDPTANPQFSTSCTSGVDCNAARATVKVSDVKYIMASMPILSGTTGTSVTKTAIAAAQCQGSAFPLPIAVCSTALKLISSSSLCAAAPLPKITMDPDTGLNACWTSLGSDSVGADRVQGVLPAECGGTPVNTSLGQNINLSGGVADSTWKALQCCVSCGNVHDFTVPVIDCSEGGGGCSGTPPVVGFATINIADAADISRKTTSKTNCQCAGGDVKNEGDRHITARQVCRADQPGKPGGTNCAAASFGNTVVPVLVSASP